MNIQNVLLAVVLVGATASPAFAGRGPSTPEERARVVKIAADSEKDPLRVQAAEERWLAKWLDEVPDIMFGPEKPARWCEGAAKGDMRKVIRFQYIASGVAYQIQHQIPAPKTQEDKINIHEAALEGVLRAYESMLATHPDVRSPQMDEALALRAKGELPAFVKAMFTGSH